MGAKNNTNNSSKTDEDYSLSEKSAFVWNWCDGTKTVSEISRQLSKKLKLPVTEDFVLRIQGIKQRQSKL